MFVKEFMYLVWLSRDVSGLHYDPTQEEHTAFESKTEAPKKERYYMNSSPNFSYLGFS